MKKLNILLYINLLFIGANCILNCIYQFNNFSFTLKCICSLLFASLGTVNLIYAERQKVTSRGFYRFQAAALFLAMLGDILIGIDFIVGACVFAMGHIVFIMSYCKLQKLRVSDIIYGLVLFTGAASFLLFYPQFDFKVPIFKIVCLVYALIISIMLGKAFSNFLKNKSLVNSIILFGSMLFFFSDLMLSLGRFSNAGRWTSHACMGTYYPALCLLAFAMYLKLRTDRKTN